MNLFESFRSTSDGFMSEVYKIFGGGGGHTYYSPKKSWGFKEYVYDLFSVSSSATPAYTYTTAAPAYTYTTAAPAYTYTTAAPTTTRTTIPPTTYATTTYATTTYATTTYATTTYATTAYITTPVYWRTSTMVSSPWSSEVEGVYKLHDGATVFSDFGEILGVPIDQVNFFISHLAAIFLGLLFRVLFPASRVGATFRHLIQICLGVALSYFCFGSQIIHILVQSLIAYMLMMCLRGTTMACLVIFYVFAYLSSCHLYRMVYDYGGYTLDITGPLMINSQKLTSLAFHLRDGSMDKSKLTPRSVKHALNKIPRLHEFLSYIFCFHSIMCGPFCFYADYIAFIDGSHFKDIPDPRYPPSPTFVIFRKLLLASIFGYLTIFVAPRWPYSMLTREEFADESFLYKNFLLVFITTLYRYRYYFAWILAEASNLSAGLGFNGYNDEGRPRWDLVDNVAVLKTEFPRSMKQFTDNWNKSTTIWLRFMVYERTGRMMVVFFTSALWHGFYPGYYITFLSAGMFVLVARKLRKLIRPHFQVTRAMSILHDMLSCPMTSLSMCYVGFPFMILLGQPSLFVYWHLYFYLHIVVVIILVFFHFFDMSSYQVKEQ